MTTAQATGPDRKGGTARRQGTGHVAPGTQDVLGRTWHGEHGQMGHGTWHRGHGTWDMGHGTGMHRGRCGTGTQHTDMGIRDRSRVLGSGNGTRPGRCYKDTTHRQDRGTGQGQETHGHDSDTTGERQGRRRVGGAVTGHALMLMRAESRSADRRRRAGRAQSGGTEGRTRGGHQSRAASAGKSRRCDPWAGGGARIPLIFPAAAPRNRDRGAGRRSEERASGCPPLPRAWCAPRAGRAGAVGAIT